MRLGVLRKLQIGMMLFGLTMGFVFPVYAGFFVEFKPGLRLWFNLGCVVAGLAVGGFSYLLVRLILLKQLAKIAAACKEIATGRIDVEISLRSPDAIGDIVVGFNLMARALGGLFDQLTTGVRHLAQITAGLASVNDQLLRTLDEQGLHVREISDTTRTATAIIAEVNGKLHTTAEFSKDINRQADESALLLKDSTRIMAQTAESLQRTLGYMEDLDKQSRDITGILSIINNIAQQTSLLSLNAAVEAARAGKHGRGFAIVAEEVKDLADRTAASTKEIAARIELFQKGVRSSINGVREHAELTGALHEKLNLSAASTGNIVERIEQIDSMLHDATGAAGNQQSSFARINTAVQGINAAFSGVQLAASRVVAGSDRLSQFASHLAAILQRFHRKG